MNISAEEITSQNNMTKAKNLDAPLESIKLSEYKKEMKHEDLISVLKTLVRYYSKQDTNPFGYGAWTHHVLPVAKYAKELAEKMGADAQIVEIAAILHDYAGIKNADHYKEHHIHGAKHAGRILKRLNYPEDKIEMVQRCIISHRGSKDIKRKSIEEQILASADAMAHFDGMGSLLYLAYVEYKHDSKTGIRFVMKKLRQGYSKLMPEAKEIIDPLYDAIRTTFIPTNEDEISINNTFHVNDMIYDAFTNQGKGIDEGLQSVVDAIDKKWNSPEMPDNIKENIGAKYNCINTALIGKK